MHWGKSITFTVVLTALCLLIMGFPASVQAGTLVGNISDKSDGSSLAGATVKVQGGAIEKPIVVAADRNGHFELKNITPGQYKVTITSVGFASRTIDNVIVADGGEKTLSVSMTPAAVNLDAVSVTASRRPEKIVNAPASVSVVESENIQDRATLTPTDHMRGLPAVDVASTGLNQSNMVVRGFNNIFSGALLVLTDNRIARVPSLRFNAYNFIPTTNDDIDRIEVVSGPGSALYGPNAANGVMQIVTKSPFASKGTTVSVGAGERELMLGSLRHAGTVSNRIGYKITGQYYQGLDWYQPRDTTLEPTKIAKYMQSTTGKIYVSDSILNERDRNIEKLAAEGRVDFLIDKDMTLILNGGASRANSIELTGLGAAQAIDWTYSYAQARYRFKDLFIQGFVNMSDAGDTYLLSTGQLIVDHSKLWAGQIQHRYAASDNVSFTYGFDALLTRPNTDGTINGVNEGDDNINELGVYLQSDIILSSQFKFVGAFRVDDHNKLEDPVFSPRAGLVYQPNQFHNFRLTYNRAFSTPDNNNLYLDILQLNDLRDMGASIASALDLDFSPEIDIRVQGVPESGFHWNWNNGLPQYRSPFAPLDPSGMMTVNDYYNFDDPVMNNVVWSIGRGAVTQGVVDQMTAMGFGQDTVLAMKAALDAVTPSAITGVDNILMTVDPDLGVAVPSSFNDIADINRLEPTITQTFELGYKGVISDKLRVSVDLYRTEEKNFIGPLTVETPNVFFNRDQLEQYLTAQIAAGLDTVNASYADLLAYLDLIPQVGGDNDGSPLDELVRMYTQSGAGIPLGTVTPREAYDPTAVLVTYRNFGDISFYGADFGMAYHLDQNWNLGATYSYISKNYFAKSDEQVHDIHLNAPRHKVGLHVQYLHPEWGLEAQARYRFIDAFDMDSPFYGSAVKAYHVVDLNAGVGFVYSTRLSLTVQNIFDNRHIEFIGGPELGRLAILRLSRTF